MSYCDAIVSMTGERKILHGTYHDTLYGFPLHNDNELFCRLALEINQAGLNWELILKKEKHFRKAFSNFNIRKVARYTEKDVARLMQDPSIIRNRLKIKAVIQNAKTILLLQKEYGSFEKWLAHHHPKTKMEWTKIFKKTFAFTGGEIVNEFLMSIGYLEGAHGVECKTYKTIIKTRPAWLTDRYPKSCTPPSTRLTT